MACGCKKKKEVPKVAENIEVVDGQIKEVRPPELLKPVSVPPSSIDDLVNKLNRILS